MNTKSINPPGRAAIMIQAFRRWMASLLAPHACSRVARIGMMVPMLVMAASTLVHAQAAEEERVMLIPWSKAPKEVPVFYSVAAQVDAMVSLSSMEAKQHLTFQVHQGQAKILSVSLQGAGDVTDVKGDRIKDWSVRVASDGQRYLDLHTADDAAGNFPTNVVADVSTKSKWKSDQFDLLLPGPANATGFSLLVKVSSAPSVEIKVLATKGLLPVNESSRLDFVSSEVSSLSLQVTQAGARMRGLEMLESGLKGQLSKDGKSISYVFDGRVRSQAAGSSMELLAGKIALVSGVSGEGWRVVLREAKGGQWVYDMVTDRAGEFPVRFAFEAPVMQVNDLSVVNFNVPAGVVMPVTLDGFKKNMVFAAGQSVVPRTIDDRLTGFLPSTGRASMGWRTKDQVEDGSLFFSSSEITDVRVGSGLMRQHTVIDLQVLQGKLKNLEFDLSDGGEVLAVSGKSVIGWNVKPVGGKRHLEVKLSQPIEKADRMIIESQVAMVGSPLQAVAIRISPIGALRHSGWLRVANEGSVRFEVMNTKGLIQLAPHQFPAQADETLREVLVYRFPSAEYGYEVHASQVLPEVSLSEVTVYQLGETDMGISTDLELDIREAPLREWEFLIPEDFAVSSVTGTSVVDFAVGSEVFNGMRSLNIIFKGAVEGRQLVQIVMTKNQAPKPGDWNLQPLGFTGVKSHRGFVGVVAIAGYRINIAKGDGMAEIPVTFFPKKIAGLQQAFRLRDQKWSAGLKVETLGQSVLADVFHLYSLKSGAVYGSVLINYFVVGAPANEWRIQVPKGVGNVDVTGQNVGRDWRKVGDIVIVPLSRPVLGTGTVLLTFEQPMNSTGGHLSPGEVKPLDVQSERGVVQVVSPLQVNHQSKSKGSLLEIDPSEIPTEFRLLSTAPTLGAWQYTDRDFEIGMEIKWFDTGETIDQLVDFQKLGTRISRDGQWVTDCQVFVKTRGRSVLRMKLPTGSVLWEAMVNGEPVNARSDADSTLIPLSSELDPNKGIEVSLRYGAQAENARSLAVVAPRFEVPVVIGEWTVTGDEGRQLVPLGGTANLIHPVLQETGWQWLERNQRVAILMLILGVAALSLTRLVSGDLAAIGGVICGFVFLVTVAISAFGSVVIPHRVSGLLEYAAPVVAANQMISIEVGNLPIWLGRAGLGVWFGFLIGVALAIRGFMKGDRWWIGGGLIAVLASFLSIHDGAIVFFLVVGIAGCFWWIPLLIRVIKGMRSSKAVATVAILTILMGLQTSRVQAENPESVRSAESIVQNWEVRDGRLFASMEITLNGQTGDRYLLLNAPAVLNRFDGTGFKVVKAHNDRENAYWLVAEQSGRLTGKAVFEMPVDLVAGLALPSGPAAVQRLTILLDQGGWEFVSPAAAKIEPMASLKPEQSGATMVLSPMKQVTLQARPIQRDPANEETRFYAEVANLFVPGPGVVNGKHRVSIRPAQGQVDKLILSVPDGFTVSDVLDGPVGDWRFDPESRELRVSIEPKQIAAFQFTVETQRSAGDLPLDLKLEPLRVHGTAGDAVGLIGLAFGEEAQPEGIKVDGLSKVNPEDFDASLLPRGDKNQVLAVLLHAFRYGGDKASVSLRVNPVAAELRAHSWQLVSLGEDRLVMTNDLDVTITRSGVFRLDLDVPESLEVESITGDGLSHWTQSVAAGKRAITLHLTGKTIGSRSFSMTMVGRAVGENEKWEVPKVNLHNASRQTGVLTIVPERGLRVRAVARNKTTQIDPRELIDVKKQIASASTKSEALSYRLLQSDWKLVMSVTRLEPWVTAQVFHDTTIREGQVLTKLYLEYRIENAAVKSQRIRIPGMDEKSASTLRANGVAVADLVPVGDSHELWEIRFRRGIAGNADVVVEYQRASLETGKESVMPIELVDVKQTSYAIALRAGGRLELAVGDLPRGWMRTDWPAVRSMLGTVSTGEPPNMVFRVTNPKDALPVIKKRHELANLRKLRVSQGVLTSLMSPSGNMLTAANLKIKVIDKSTLRLKLPKGAELFNVFVNNEGASLVREGDDWLFYVFPSPDTDRPTEVRFVYASVMRGGKTLEGPMLDVPMENLSWRLLVPEGWRVDQFDGDFDLKNQQNMGSFRLEDYQSFVNSKRAMGAETVAQQLNQANQWLEVGDQKKASLALSNVLNNGQLDAASSEDARVQLRKLKTQQAVLGLNSRRQKWMLDNRNAAPQQELNPQVNRAAEINSVLQGQYNYDPKQFDRFLEGNTADENTALKSIANRIVAQQLAAEPAPTALDILLPDRGTVWSFARSVQVDGKRPMTMDIRLIQDGKSFSWLAVMLCIMVGAMGVLVYKRPARVG